ncbi:glycosyltransferase family 2 protein [Chryseobacterium sp. LC2016-27]|jgi:glycosyltransferase involved in cell wall biosynthesis|uniref:glycosyltransferase family 2 protein n=1 Tax=Chryseobacterium sp. LC2016-27 TaxID=2897326 RepID=UPI001E5A0513|nr:glycosyltransferase family A protein [Chryseobacterium sp. LC2016-27]MCD0454075.1 glycosyltransferase family 2 protein [Chryseobacterium sp. LC2016-27]
MSNFLISIIVPCYDQAQYLDECLQSVLDQTYPNWECIIVSDGSPDNAEEVTKGWVEKDHRFKYIYKKNGGVSSARNAGITIAKGEWILPLDADDKIAPDYLTIAMKEFQNDPHIVYCHAEYFGEKNGEMLLQEFNRYDLLIENHIFCTSFFKKESWEAIGGYDENMLNGYEDWEFWIHFIAQYKDIKIVRINYTGMKYRIKNISKNISAKKNDLPIKQYIFKKHSQLYLESINQLSEYFYIAKKLKKENTALYKIINSKRFQYLNNFFKIIGR